MTREGFFEFLDGLDSHELRIDIALAFGACVVFTNSKTEGSDSLARWN